MREDIYDVYRGLVSRIHKLYKSLTDLSLIEKWVKIRTSSFIWGNPWSHGKICSLTSKQKCNLNNKMTSSQGQVFLPRLRCLLGGPPPVRPPLLLIWLPVGGKGELPDDCSGTWVPATCMGSLGYVDSSWFQPVPAWLFWHLRSDSVSGSSLSLHIK